MVHQINAEICARAGCVCVVLPLPIDVVTKVLKGPASWLLDSHLGERTGCLVYGSKTALNNARKQIGIEVIP